MKDPEKYQSQFDTILSIISEIFEDDIKNTKFKTTSLFYDLFCAIYHHEFGIKLLGIKRTKLLKKRFPQIKKRLLEINVIVEEGNTKGSEDAQYYNYAKGATTDKPRRLYRVKYLAKRIADCM